MILEKLYNIIADQFMVTVDTLSPDTNFKEDLDADSIDLVQLALTLEEELGLPEPKDGEELPETETIGALLEYVNSVLGE